MFNEYTKFVTMIYNKILFLTEILAQLIIKYFYSDLILQK
jgi:hypothetical protein